MNSGVRKSGCPMPRLMMSLALVGLHVVAALYHHYVLHDGVLKRMLPR